MKCNSKPFTQINRQYILTSAELRKALNIKGEILNVNLWKGRSPNDIEKKVSPDKDEWEIQTKEVQER